MQTSLQFSDVSSSFSRHYDYSDLSVAFFPSTCLYIVSVWKRQTRFRLSISNQAIMCSCAIFHPSGIQWAYKADVDSCDSDSTEWCAYSDVETAIIEEAFQKKLPEATLDEYIISFLTLIQISRRDMSDQRPVKRLDSQREQKLRRARFMSDPINPSNPFGPSYLGNFRRATHDLYNLPGFAYTHKENSLNNPSHRREMVRRAADGIIIEGKKVGREREGEWIAQKLLSVIDGTPTEVWRMCAHVYTMESFLFRKLNECMRLEGEEEHEDVWKSKVATFGPFSLLLYYLGEYTDGTWTVYRGCNLSEDSIEMFRQRIANDSTIDEVVFSAFTSTSRNRSMAELLGNVLFVIEIQGDFDGCDVAPYSVFDEEEEYLLAPYFMFSIRSCEFDDEKNKWIIHLRSGRLD